MDWFLYDNGLRHERVNDTKKVPYFYLKQSILQHFYSIVLKYFTEMDFRF